MTAIFNQYIYVYDRASRPQNKSVALFVLKTIKTFKR